MSTDLLPLGDMTPRLVTKLVGNPNRVMQSFTRAPWSGEYFEAQVDDDASANMRITRCDESGKALDYVVLQGAGHGSSITAEYADGKVWIWLWWQIDRVSGAQASPVRWAYQGTPSGAYVLLEDAEPVPDPDSAQPGHTWGQFAIDQAKDRIATYFRSGNTERFTLWKLSDYKAGTGTALTRATVTKPSTASFQGFTTSDTHAYISRGGSAVDDIAPTLYELDWDSGTITATKDVSGLALVAGGYASGGHNEAEGVCLWRSQDGTPQLLFGIVTGPLKTREARVYRLAAPVDGSASKTLLLDVEKVTGAAMTNAVVSLSYDRLVRHTNGGMTPAPASEPVKLSEKDRIPVFAADHESLTDDSYGFVMYARIGWDDPSEPGKRKSANYTAQVSAADPDVVALSSVLVASGTVAPGQIIGGRPGPPGPANELVIGSVIKGDDAAATLDDNGPGSQTLNLVLPQGEPGADSTVPGPANSLSIGTVTQGAAAASITGAAPEQTLNLVVPKGEKGDPGVSSIDPSSFELRGTGSPVGVVTPPNPGTFYTDRAGTAGAWRWISTGTTNTSWAVVYGDTGARSLVVEATVATSGVITVQRQNGLATVTVRDLALAAGVSGTVTLTAFIPTGFRPPENSNLFVLATAAGVNNPVRLLVGRDGNFKLYDVPSNAVINASFTYPPANAWPAILP